MDPLGSGDFALRRSEGKTVLTARFPGEKRRIEVSGEPKDWSWEDWRKLLRKARSFDRDDLIEDLERMRDGYVADKIRNEKPVFDDDSSETAEGVHSVSVHRSREEDYIRVLGPATYQFRDELRDLGLRWRPEKRVWEARYDGEVLDRVSEFVVENDTVYDPFEIGYVRCDDCGGFRPEGKSCSCRS